MTVEKGPRTNVPDCGNAPRRAIIRDVTVELYGRRAEELAGFLSEQVVWEIVGGTTLTGIVDVTGWIREQAMVEEIRVATILTHGREGGVDGSIDMDDGRTFGFSHVFRFASTAKTAGITGVRSYLVETS